MKSRIFLYLFLFAALFIVFQYMNQKSIFESQNKKIESLSEKLQLANDSIKTLQEQNLNLNYFTLNGNENAMSYLENLGLDPIKTESLIKDLIYEKNLEQGGNSLIPYNGVEGNMRVNKIKFLNHRWIVADFSDGLNWGEVLIDYFYDDKMQLQLTTLVAVLYPN